MVGLDLRHSLREPLRRVCPAFVAAVSNLIVWRSHLSPTLAERVVSQMKEDLAPPTPQQSSPASRVIPRAAYWAHLTATVATMLLVALHLGRANQSVNLAWDANPEPDIAKYKVYWGLESGAPTESLDVGKVTAATVRHLDDGATYFFTVTAINEAGEESEPSNEVFYTTAISRLYSLTAVRDSGSGRYPAALGACACRNARSRRTICALEW